MDRAAETPRRADGTAAQIRGASAALSFLTRIPSYRFVAHGPEDLRNATAYFPLVGVVVGVAGAITFGIASTLWTPTVAAILSVALTVWCTGAFHEDALADSFDGFGGGWDKTQVLTIMKDSRVGSYALVGVALILATKIAALVAVADNAHAVSTAPRSTIAAVGRALIAAHVLARWTSVLLMRTTPYVRVARPDERPSAGGPFADRATSTATVAATLFTLAVVGVVLRRQAIAAVVVAIIVTWLARRYFIRRIGGITGDALGAANQFAELAVYLTLAAHLSA